MVLEKGVIEGRRTFCWNTSKWRRVQISVTFFRCECFYSIFTNAAYSFTHLLYDVSQIVIPFDNVDEERNHSVGSLKKLGVSWWYF